MSAENGTTGGPARSPLPIALGLALVAAVLAVAWPALSAELVYDDLKIIRQNPRITSLANWPQAFTATYWEFLEPGDADRIGYWRPLTTLAHTFVYVLSDGSTRAFHAASIAVHLLAVLAAFRYARRLTRSAQAAFFAALLFGLHPINVESWAWVSALNSVLAGLLGILALDAHLRWRRAGGVGSPLRAALLFALALLTKETAIAVLPMALVVELATGGGAAGEGARRSFGTRLRPLARSYLPLLVVVVVYWLARVLVFGSLGAGIERVTTEFGPDVDTVRLLRLRIELLGGGLRHAFLPDPALFRPFRPVIPASDPTFLRALAALAAVTVAGAIAYQRRARVALAALALAVCALLPILLRVASLGSFPLADRFLYLTTFGVALFVAHLLTTRLPRGLGVAALALLAAFAGHTSRARAEMWSDEASLFEVAVEESPDSPYVHWGLGRVRLERYQRERDPADLAESLACFERSADLLERALSGDSSIFATKQDAEQTNVGLGWCYLFEAEAEGSQTYGIAEKIFEAALRGSPNSESAYTGLGVALQAQHKTDEALAAYERALEINPRFVEAHHNIAQLHLRMRDWDAAREHLEKALELRPDHYADVILLARAQFEEGQVERARATAERAHDLAPDRAEPFEVLAVIAGVRGDGATAMRHLDEALRLEPNYGRIHYLRANEFQRRKDTASALSSLRRACDLMPTDFAAHHDLGALLLSQGAVEAALPFLTRAYELCTDEARLALMRRTMETLRPSRADAPLAWARADRRRGAQDWVEKWSDLAVEADPTHAPARLFRSNLSEMEGDLEGAADDLRAAVDAAPSSFTIHVELGRVLSKLGRVDEARGHLERGLELGPPEDWELELRRTAIARAERLLQDLENAR